MKLPFHQKLYLLLRLSYLCSFLFIQPVLANTTQPNQIGLNQAELDWLASHPVVKVAISDDYAPISFVDADGQHIGISADYLANIQQQLKAINPKFQFETVVPNTDQKAANDPLDKQVDMVVDFVQTPERLKYWQFSKPYLSLPLHLIMRKGKKSEPNLNRYSNAKVAVVSYYAAQELIAKDYPNLQLELVESNQEGLKKVAFGEVNAFISDLPVASYWASQAGLVQLKNTSKLAYSYEISFASSRQIPILGSILEKSLARINNNKREKINDRWLIGPFIEKPLFSNMYDIFLLLTACILALLVAWLIYRKIQQNKRLAKQQQALALLTQNQLRQNQDLDDIYREVALSAAQTLNVARASIWLFDEDKKQFDCICLYLKSSQTYTTIKPLIVSDLPVYFQALTSSRVIAINDAMQNPITQEFKHGYLQDNDIGAMLDSTIRLNGVTIGVVCLEHTNGKRNWTLDEQNFGGSIADICRICLETCRRRHAEQTLLKLNENLEQEVEARALLLRESEKRYNYVFEHAPIPILILKKNGEIIEVNPEAESAFGAPRESILGENFVKTIVAPESRKTAALMAARSLKGQAFRNIELTLQNVFGAKVEHVCSIGMVTDLDEDQGQMVAIAQNISQQKLLQRSLAKARESAESADRIKSMFVASMSHELRTPLNSIIGFLGVVLHGMSGELNLKQKDQLGRAYHSSKHLLSLITDVIDISKIEAGYLQVHVEKFVLANLLAEVQSAVQHLAEEKDIQLFIDCDAKIKLDTDRKRLYQVVLNVVSNALKYSEEGAVNVAAIIKGKQLTITVQDTGIGIGEADLANLFKPFVRLDSHLKIRTLGTGLGLYLTRKILSQLLGGEISVQSQLGLGSTFTIKVPVKMPVLVAQNHISVLEDSAP